jgi:hypothetical protein
VILVLIKKLLLSFPPFRRGKYVPFAVVLLSLSLCPFLVASCSRTDGSSSRWPPACRSMAASSSRPVAAVQHLVLEQPLAFSMQTNALLSFLRGKNSFLFR